MGTNILHLLAFSYIITSLICWGVSGHAPSHHERTWSVRSSSHNDNFVIQLNNYPASPGKHTLSIQNLNMHCEKGIEPSAKNEFSTSKIAMALIDKYLGPDELLIDIQGKTLQSFVPSYHSCGNYSQTFHITLPGVYHFTLLRLRSQYVAVNELVLEFPHVETEYLISEWLDFPGTERKEPFCGEEGGFAGYWQATANNLALKAGVFDDLKLAQETTPYVTMRRENNFGNIEVPMINGYRLMSFVNISSHAASSRCADVVDEYEWVPGPCPWQLYRTDNKDRNKFEVVLAGDSHLQRLSYGLKDYLDRVVDIFTDDSSLGKTLPHRDANQKANSWLFANVGHHPAAHNHYPVNKYIQLMNSFVRMLQDEGYSDKNFVWIESNPLPIRQDHYVIENKDWRTLHRIKLFNLIAEDILRSNGFMNIVHTFQESLPFSHEACDVAHYIAPHANDPVIQQVLQFYYSKLK